MIPHIDRLPTNPGRVLMTPVPGQSNLFDLERADNPTQGGTPQNKALFDEFLAASGTTSGTGSALTLDQPGFSLFSGALVQLTLHTELLANATLNVTGTGAYPLQNAYGSPASVGVPAGAIIRAVFNGSAYVVQTDLSVLIRGMKNVWFLTASGEFVVPRNMKLKLTAIGQGGTPTAQAPAGFGGGGGGCVIDERYYAQGDVLSCEITSAATRVLCAARDLDTIANAAIGGTGGTAQGGNVANYTGGNGGAHGTANYANGEPGEDSEGCAGGGGMARQGSSGGNSAGNGGAGGVSCGNGGRGYSATYSSGGNGGSSILALFGGNGGGGQSTSSGPFRVGGKGGDAAFMGGSGGNGGSGGAGGDGGNATRGYNYRSAFGWYSFGGRGGNGGNANSTARAPRGGNGGKGAVGGDGGTGGNRYNSSTLYGFGGDGGAGDFPGTAGGEPTPGTGGIGMIGNRPPLANYGGGNYIAGVQGLPLLIIEEV